MKTDELESFKCGCLCSEKWLWDCRSRHLSRGQLLFGNKIKTKVKQSPNLKGANGDRGAGMEERTTSAGLLEDFVNCSWSFWHFASMLFLINNYLQSQDKNILDITYQWAFSLKNKTIFLEYPYCLQKGWISPYSHQQWMRVPILHLTQQ